MGIYYKMDSLNPVIVMLSWTVYIKMCTIFRDMQKDLFLWIGNCVFIWCGLDHESHKWACAVTHYVWLVPWKAEYRVLTQRVLVTSYCERDQGQHWLMQWCVIWRHQSITWSKVDVSSVRSGDIHPRAISLEIPQPPASTITYLQFHWNLPGANEM